MKKVKKIPLRKCVGCQAQFAKRDLIRVVRDKEGNVSLDKTGRANGRGAYICNKSECLVTALKRKAIQRALEVELAQEIQDELMKAIQDE